MHYRASLVGLLVVCATAGACTPLRAPSNAGGDETLSASDLLPAASPATSPTRRELPAPMPVATDLRYVSQGPVASDASFLLDQPGGATLEQLLQFTLENHPRLRARRYEVEVEQAKVIAAETWSNPQMVFDTDVRTDNEETDLAGRVMFPIPLGPRRHYAIRAAEAGAARARIAIEEESQKLLLETADAAIEVLYYQELARSLQNLVRLSREAAEIQLERATSGTIPQVEADEAIADAAEIEFDVTDAQSDLQIAQMRLARALGLTTPRPIEVNGRLVTDSIPELSLATILAVARHNQPDISKAEAGLIEKQWEEQLAAALGVPDLEIGPRWGETLHDPNGRIGGRINIDLPIFDRNQGGRAEAQAEVRLAAALLAEAQASALADVATTALQLQNVQQRVQHYRDHVIPLAERNEEDIAAGFQARTLDPKTVSGLLRRLARSRRNYLELVYRYNRLRTQLELQLGQQISQVQEQVAPPRPTPPLPAGPLPEPPPLDGAASSSRRPRMPQRSDERIHLTAAPGGYDDLGVTPASPNPLRR